MSITYQYHVEVPLEDLQQLQYPSQIDIEAVVEVSVQGEAVEAELLMMRYISR